MGDVLGTLWTKTRTPESFWQDDSSLRTVPFLCYILYIEQWEFSTEQWVWCLMNMWSMLHVISVICLV